MKNIIRNIFAVLVATVAVAGTAYGQTYGNVFAKKTATNNYDGTYTLTMETYATGNHVLTETKNPVDAVLVLDLSNSMKKGTISATKSYMMNSSAYTLRTLLSGDKEPKEYYIYWSDGNYYQLSGKKKEYATFTVGSTTYGIKADGTVYSTYAEVPEAYQTVVLHQQKDNITYLEALKEGCAIFVSNLKVDEQQWNAEHSADEQIEHRVAIVTYNCEANVLLEFSAGDAYKNYSDIIDKIASFATNDMTYSNLGMEKAYDLLAADTKTDATKLVVFFTDGDPNDPNGDGLLPGATDVGSFSTVAANKAIAWSYKIKNEEKASVYSLSVISQKEGTPQYNFLDYLSSNYPEAENLDTPGTQKSGDYFTIATKQETLTSVFDQISRSISGGSEPKLDSSAYLLDIVSQYFMLPLHTSASAVSAYTNDLQSINGSEYVFGTDKTTSGLSITVDGKKIKVSGFNYTENFCGTHMTASGSGDYESEIRGKRLVVEVTVVPDPDGADDDSGYSPTNDDDSGIYTAEGEVVKKFVTEPSAVYSEADLTVKISGLAPGESAVFTIESDVNITLYGTTGKFTRTVVLTAGADGTASAVVKAPVTYAEGKFVEYTVSPTTWSWAYDIDKDSISKELFDDAGNPDHVFKFVATPKTTGVESGEDSKENDFDWHTEE